MKCRFVICLTPKTVLPSGASIHKWMWGRGNTTVTINSLVFSLSFLSLLQSPVILFTLLLCNQCKNIMIKLELLALTSTILPVLRKTSHAEIYNMLLGTGNVDSCLGCQSCSLSLLRLEKAGTHCCWGSVKATHCFLIACSHIPRFLLPPAVASCRKFPFTAAVEASPPHPSNGTGSRKPYLQGF